LFSKKKSNFTLSQMVTNSSPTASFKRSNYVIITHCQLFVTGIPNVEMIEYGSTGSYNLQSKVLLTGSERKNSRYLAIFTPSPYYTCHVVKGDIIKL
jgi:hypothetical protein